MPSFIEGELHDQKANCPQSLEGRLLFAVPKSESIRVNKGSMLTKGRGQASTGSA